MEKVIIGNCTLIHGDCETVMKELESGSIDSMISDPPYLYLDHELDRDFDTKSIFSQVDRLLKNDRLIAFFGRGYPMFEWALYFRDLGYEFKESMVWDKKQSSSPFGNIQRIHEDICLLSKGRCAINKIHIDYTDDRTNKNELKKIAADIKEIKSRLNNKEQREALLKYIESGKVVYDELNKSFSKHNIASRSKEQLRATPIVRIMNTIINGLVQTSIISVNRERSLDEKHPTKKPIELMERLVTLCTKPNDLVLDCFMGGGSTAVACANTGRQFIGCEINKEYFDLAVKQVTNAYASKQHELELV